MPDPLIRGKNFGVSFDTRSRWMGTSSRFWGVNQINFLMEKEDTFCLIGESGSGKSTLALALTGLLPFHSGLLLFKGKPITKPNDKVHKTLIRCTQMVFQDPVQALSPFRTLRQSLEEPLAARGVTPSRRRDLLAPLIRDTELTESLLKRRPHQVSGGQNQRVCIARALSTQPELLILDEPLTALDSLIKSRITRVLCRLKEKYPVTCFLITHDMDLVRVMATRIGVIYLGHILETASKASLLAKPAHPYTRALLSASFTPGIWKGKRVILKGDIPPSAQAPSKGCIFHSRCPEAMKVCEQQTPPSVTLSSGHTVSCHLYTDNRRQQS